MKNYMDVEDLEVYRKSIGSFAGFILRFVI
jgi:hypothetical protein